MSAMFTGTYAAPPGYTAFAAPMMTGFGANRAIVAGSARSEDAKMIGITPAEFTLNGKYELFARPPAWNRVEKNAPKNTGRTALSPFSPASDNVCPKDDGSEDTMFVKISSDVPFPSLSSFNTSPMYSRIIAPAVRTALDSTNHPKLKSSTYGRTYRH
eukprot:31198-Pelagococcus_subviridis.AAC.31